MEVLFVVYLPAKWDFTPGNEMTNLGFFFIF